MLLLRPFLNNKIQTNDDYQNDKEPNNYFFHNLSYLVPGQGLEPQFSRPERDVLPLDDPGILEFNLQIDKE